MHVLEQQAQLHVRDDERSGQDFESEDSFHGRLLDLARRKASAPFSSKVFADAFQHSTR
jgi:hypothetical protein